MNFLYRANLVFILKDQNSLIIIIKTSYSKFVSKCRLLKGRRKRKSIKCKTSHIQLRWFLVEVQLLPGLTISWTNRNHNSLMTRIRMRTCNTNRVSISENPVAKKASWCMSKANTRELRHHNFSMVRSMIFSLMIAVRTQMINRLTQDLGRWEKGEHLITLEIEWDFRIFHRRQSHL